MNCLKRYPHKILELPGVGEGGGLVSPDRNIPCGGIGPSWQVCVYHLPTPQAFTATLNKIRLQQLEMAGKDL